MSKFDMSIALQVCTATISKRTKSRPNGYVLYYANSQDKERNRYTGKVEGATIEHCKAQFAELDRDYPVAFIARKKDDVTVRFYNHAFRKNKWNAVPKELQA